MYFSYLSVAICFKNVVRIYLIEVYRKNLICVSNFGYRMSLPRPMCCALNPLAWILNCWRQVRYQRPRKPLREGPLKSWISSIFFFTAFHCSYQTVDSKNNTETASFTRSRDHTLPMLCTCVQKTVSAWDHSSADRTIRFHVHTSSVNSPKGLINFLSCLVVN